MAADAGIDHLALTVTDLDASERFYTGVLDFVLVVDFGEVRSLLHRTSRLWLSLVRHASGGRGPFSELDPGLDHIGLVASHRGELVEWERRFATAGVAYTPIRDMPFGAHLNFRDPDGIALEFMVPDAVLVGWERELCERDIPRAEIDSRIREHLVARGVPEAALPSSIAAAAAVD